MLALAASSLAACPPRLTLMAQIVHSGAALDVCEDLSSGLNGSITFLPTAGGGGGGGLFPLTLRSRAYANGPPGGDDARYLNFTKAQVLKCARAGSNSSGLALLADAHSPTRAPTRAPTARRRT